MDKINIFENELKEFNIGDKVKLNLPYVPACGTGGCKGCALSGANVEKMSFVISKKYDENTYGIAHDGIVANCHFSSHYLVKAYNWKPL